MAREWIRFRCLTDSWLCDGGAGKPRTHWRPRDTGFRAFGRRARQLVRGKPRLESRAGFRAGAREARKVGGSIRRKLPQGKVAVHLAPNRVQSPPVGRQTSVSICERPLLRQLGASRNRARAGRKNGVLFSLGFQDDDCELAVLGVCFLTETHPVMKKRSASNSALSTASAAPLVR